MITYSQYNGYGRQYRHIKADESFWLDGGTMRVDLGSDATGDLLYRKTDGFIGRLGIGTHGHILTSINGLPVWQAPPTDNNENSYTFSTGLTNNSGTVKANLSTGIAGGQSVVGGVAAGENLTLSSTAHATKGSVLLADHMLPTGNNTINLGSSTVRYANVHAFNVSSGGASLALKSTGANVGVFSNNTERMRVFGTGSTVFQNGGTFADDGYLVDVKGSFRTTGLNTFAGLAGAGVRMVVVDAGGVVSTQNIPQGVSYTAGGGISITNGVISNTRTNTSHLTNDSGFITSVAHTHGVANSAGTQQFTFAQGETIRFAATGGTTAAFDVASKTITFSSASGISYAAGAGISITNGVITNTRTLTSQLTNDSGFITTAAHNHTIANAAGTAQFNFGIGEAIRIAGANGNSITFDGPSKTITITAPTPSGGTTYSAGAGIAISGGNVISNTRTHTSHLTNDSGFISSLAHNHVVYNGTGTQQFTYGVNEGIRFEGAGVTFDPALKKVIIAGGGTASLQHMRVAFGSPTNTITHSGDLIFNNQTLWVNSQGVSGGGISVDGAINPTLTMRSAGVVRGALTTITSAGAYVANAQAGDIALFASGGRLLLGVGAGNTELTLTNVSTKVNSLVGVGAAMVVADSAGVLKREAKHSGGTFISVDSNNVIHNTMANNTFQFVRQATTFTTTPSIDHGMGSISLLPGTYFVAAQVQMLQTNEQPVDIHFHIYLEGAGFPVAYASEHVPYGSVNIYHTSKCFGVVTIPPGANKTLSFGITSVRATVIFGGDSGTTNLFAIRLTN